MLKGPDKLLSRRKAQAAEPEPAGTVHEDKDEARDKANADNGDNDANANADD